METITCPLCNVNGSIEEDLENGMTFCNRCGCVIGESSIRSEVEIDCRDGHARVIGQQCSGIFTLKPF
jgi:transcription initiation factor TFIIIB Brf1 subunit/transcription initiation factor TFIIB